MMNIDGLYMHIRHGKGTSAQGSLQRIAERFTVKRNSTTNDLGDVLILVVFADMTVLYLLSLTEDTLEAASVRLSATDVSYTVSLLLLALSLVSSLVFALNSRLNATNITL